MTEDKWKNINPTYLINPEKKVALNQQRNIFFLNQNNYTCFSAVVGGQRVVNLLSTL